MTEIERLKEEVGRLTAENKRLKGLLDSHGISWQPVQVSATHTDVLVRGRSQDVMLSPPPQESDATVLRQPMPMDTAAEKARRISLFMKLFCARKDFYAERWEGRDGRKGYAPVCSNRWKPNCPKRTQKGIKCHECPEHAWIPFTEEVAYRHLVGQDERGKPFVAGTYALLEDSSCKFLVFDFDDHDGSNLPWQEEATLLREICRNQGIDTALERSRSGSGAHVWIFFDHPIPARLARRFGAALLAQGMESVHQKDFNTFDRMMPNQDEMPAGGMGNLIALPLQGLPRKQGNSVFVDDDWNAIHDQWGYLSSINCLPPEFVEKKIAEWGKQEILDGTEESSEDESGKPWEKKKPPALEKADVSEPLSLTLADCVYIPKRAVKPRTMNRIRKMATFSNPQFYKMQAMRYSTKQIPRRIQCFRDLDDYVTLPRGCLPELEERLRSADISYVLNDRRTDGRLIDVLFQGTLQPEQEKAAAAMLEHETGILGAATGFGKTVLGTYLIASRKVNTLILVHNREIMKQWQEDLARFLEIREEIPVEEGKRKRKPRSIVGTLYARHDSLHGFVDVAMISSLGHDEEIDERVADYGMVIMDECHHAGAYTFENVLWKVKARYVYGLTATPLREDGHEKIVFMQLGPVRYRLTEKDRAAMQEFRHEIAPRFTGFSPVTQETPNINDLYKLLISDKARNKLLAGDILAAVDKGRTPLVLTKFKEHAELLFGLLKEKEVHPILLMGGGSAKEREARRAALVDSTEDERLVIIATGKYIGEGFNFPRLDTLFLTVPVSWKGNIAQYAGRLHRDFEGKESVIIYDYVDVHVKMLERMYQKRLSAYASMGYTIFSPTGDGGANVIYTVRDYQERFWQDFREATDRIVISSPRISRQRVAEFVQRVKADKRSQMEFVVWTLPDEEYAQHQRSGIQSMKRAMQDAAIDVREKAGMNCHFAVMDENLVWYGSMNFLSREHDDDILMRLRNEAVVEELMRHENQQKDN
ncbi:MAG: DEAD/DEAH box helicase family protein [Selenomonadaceae bacterium]|nr:DEAD/DEAH box helicase family protein [Selenomonadaceae bacterium]